MGNNIITDNDLLTRKQVLAYLNITAPTLKRFVDKGKFKAYKFSPRKMYFKREEITSAFFKL